MAGLALGAINGSSGSGVEHSEYNSWGLGGGNSASSSYDRSNAYGYGMSEGFGEGWENSWSDAYSENFGRTYGREASAQDIENAREANAVQMNMWGDQAKFNAEQAMLDRKFQEYMSNTAYQRAVRDLRAAGLNPILAVGNMGASTPQGATASAGLATSSKANAFAESTSGGYSRSNSSSSAYNYNKNSSKNENWSKSEGKSSSYGNNWQRSGASSIMDAASQYSNNVKELAQGAIGAAGTVYTNAINSAKDAANDSKDRKNYNKNGSSRYKTAWGNGKAY